MEKKNKVGRADVLGKYLRLMKMNQYKDYRYKDTDQLEFKFIGERKLIKKKIKKAQLMQIGASLEFL